jgi:subtilisin family serine protease
VVAIVDSGVDPGHPDLLGQLLPQPEDESWDFSGARERLPRDRLGHGTGIAGVIAAAGRGMVGVAPGCRLLPLRVDLVSGAARDRAAAIDFVARRARADRARRYVLNAGWQVDGPDPEIERAIAAAAAAEVVMVFAAGNGGAPAASYPAYRPDVIAVAATDQHDRLSELSNHGAGVDLAAPGESIYSTFPTYFLAGRRPYLFRSGTSMAAAFVAGVAALVLSVAPALSAVEVRRILEQTCDEVEAGAGTRRLGAGRLNAAKAVAAALAAPSALR